jgi:CelD/BcsL family acetyltransferase involved in cellulose biosynthesis
VIPVFEVEILYDAAELEPIRAAWAELSARALEPNAFLDPALLMPALRHLPRGSTTVATLLIWRRSSGSRELVGLMPIARSLRTKRLPLASFGTWAHPYSFFGTPLLAIDHATEALDALLNWAWASERPGRILRLDRVAADGPFATLIEAACRRRRVRPYVDRRLTRPLYRPTDPPTLQHYCAVTLSKRRRNKVARGRRRLERSGTLTVTEARDSAAAEATAHAFLELEARGWKGRAGSAIACSSADVAFFLAVVRGFAESDRLMMVALRLDGAPVAVSTTLLTGNGGFVFKSAFDERHGDASPGMLVEVETLRCLLVRPAVRWVDSCVSIPTSPLHALYGHARSIQTLLVPVGDWMGNLVVASLPPLGALVRRWRARRESAQGAPGSS